MEQVKNSGGYMRKANLDTYEVLELLECIFSDEITVEEDEYDEADRLCDEHFDCDIDTFKNIVEHLLPMTPVMKSAISEEYFHKFGKRHKDYFEAIVKMEYKIK